MLEKVIEFVSKATGVPANKITAESRFEDDFGMAGLDSMIFYENFFRDFKIQNPEEFNADRYISDDGFENFSLKQFIKAIFSKEARNKLRTKDVSVGHLAKVAELKKWFEEEATIDK